MNDKYFRRLQRAKELEISEEFVQPNIILGSTLDDYYEDMLNQGLVGPSNLFGSILTDADTLSYGLITRNIEFPFISDTDLLNHGLINNGISGSLLESTNTFDSGKVTFVKNLKGSILECAGTFLNNSLRKPISGSILENIDILHQGTLFIGIAGSILENISILHQGNVYPAAILGSLFQDSDNIFSGNIPSISVCKILIPNKIVGGNTVNLVKKVVLVSTK